MNKTTNTTSKTVMDELKELQEFNSQVQYRPRLTNDQAFAMIKSVTLKEQTIFKQVVSEIGFPEKGKKEQANRFNERKRELMREAYGVKVSLPAWPSPEIRDIYREAMVHGLEEDTFRRLKDLSVQHYKQNAAQYFDAFAVEAGFVEEKR